MRVVNIFLAIATLASACAPGSAHPSTTTSQGENMHLSSSAFQHNTLIPVSYTHLTLPTIYSV